MVCLVERQKRLNRGCVDLRIELLAPLTAISITALIVRRGQIKQVHIIDLD